MIIFIFSKSSTWGFFLEEEEDEEWSVIGSYGQRWYWNSNCGTHGWAYGYA